MKSRKTDLELIRTKDKLTQSENGIFVPVWRDWDSKLSIVPSMVYYMTLDPGTSKGPHLHKLRTSNITCISGKVKVVLKSEGTYETTFLKASEPCMIEVLPLTGLLISNESDETAIVLNICSPAWHPDNPDNYSDDFSDFIK
jgi:dTDP-4-dehydrorhamnose 3,5-epimerase-like enzyme